MKLDSMLLLSEFKELNSEQQMAYIKMLSETTYDEIIDLNRAAILRVGDQDSNLADDVDNLLAIVKNTLDPKQTSELYTDLMSTSYFAAEKARDDIYDENQEWLKQLASYDAALQMQRMMDAKYDTQFRDQLITLEEYNLHKKRSAKRMETIMKHKKESEGMVEF